MLKQTTALVVLMTLIGCADRQDDEGWCITSYSPKLNDESGDFTYPQFDGEACVYGVRKACRDAGGDYTDIGEVDLADDTVFCPSEGYPKDCFKDETFFVADDTDCPDEDA